MRSQCAATAERWGQLVGATSITVPAVITAERLAAMQARNKATMQPGEHKRAGLPDDGFY